LWTGKKLKYAILSDIHANWPALQAVEAKLDQLRGIGDEILLYFLGDLVGYGPGKGAISCVDWLHRKDPLSVKWLPGNHDEWLLTARGRYSLRASMTLTLHRAFLMSPENQELWDWFSTQVKQKLERSDLLQFDFFDKTGNPTKEMDQAKMSLVRTHAAISFSPRETYLYPWKKEMLVDEWRQAQKHVNTPAVSLLYGHTHYPFFARINKEATVALESICYGIPQPLGEGFVAINPGSVGQPRDGDPRAAFAILDTKEQVKLIENIRT
jgi:predicted phosphodiesterase